MAMDTIEREDTALIIVPEGQDARALFEAKDTAGADRLLAMVRAKIDAFKAELPSVETEAGRKRIKSFAYKIAQFKTAIDDVGKEIVDEAKELPKRIDANRRHLKVKLDAWRDEVRQPVTDWETAEEARVGAIKAKLNELQSTIDDPDWTFRSSESLRDSLGEIERDFCNVCEAHFGEYVSAALELKTAAVSRLTERIAAAEKREAEAAELARLRSEAEERARKDREAEIARKAADDAKRDAEAKAEAERLAAQKREDDLKAAAAKAEQERKDAEQRTADAERAAREQAERDAKAKADAEEAERKRREADKAHMARINRQALDSLVAAGINEEIAKQVLTLIIKREIPHVSLSY